MNEIQIKSQNFIYTQILLIHFSPSFLTLLEINLPPNFFRLALVFGTFWF